MLKVEGLSTEYPNERGAIVRAAQDVSFEVPEGQLFTLLGPSGCGKTTTLRSIAGLERPRAGEISVGDRVVYSGSRGIFVAPNRRGFGMVFQSYAIWPHMNVFQNAAFPLEVGARRLGRAQIRERVMRVLTAVQLNALAEREATKLSGGQQQRLALARARDGAEAAAARRAALESRRKAARPDALRAEAAAARAPRSGRG